MQVNGASAADAVRGAQAVELPIGLHFNVTEGLPMSLRKLPQTANIARSSLFTDIQGQSVFLGKEPFFAAIDGGLIDPHDVGIEVNVLSRAQY